MFTKMQLIKDGIITVISLVVAFGINLIVQKMFNTQTLIPMIFVMGVFVVSLLTQGYFWGITASLVSVLAVNFAFTFPFYAFDLFSPECLFSAVVMLVVAIVTGTLTTKIKTQEKMKAESDKERMRANLLRAVSHDLRTPLTSIYGSCSAIMENFDSLSKEQKIKLLSEMQSDSQWLIRMVENLLSVTKIDTEKVKVSKTETVAEELIDAVLVKFYKHYPDISVEVKMPEEFISIPMDAMLIEQVLINLLENAIVHAKGMTKLTLRIRTYNNVCVFEVIDDGCGISEDKMKNLFTGFLESTDSTADGRRSSMGIGLNVCSTIIKAHGGEIGAYNNVNGGATVYFELSMEDANE